MFLSRTLASVLVGIMNQGHAIQSGAHNTVSNNIFARLVKFIASLHKQTQQVIHRTVYVQVFGQCHIGQSFMNAKLAKKHEKTKSKKIGRFAASGTWPLSSPPFVGHSERPSAKVEKGLYRRNGGTNNDRGHRTNPARITLAEIDDVTTIHRDIPSIRRTALCRRPIPIVYDG